MRTIGALLAALAGAFAGCGGGGGTTPIDGSVDAAGPQWWQPKVGEAKNWDVQLSGTIDVSAPRTMYDLDLWALVPSATTLDYGDGTPVTVHAGTMAGAIAALHARTPSTIVICHIETGLLDLNAPDAPKFPGYVADPTKLPDNPAAPAPGVTVMGPPAPDSVIGWSLGVAKLRFLDVGNRSKWSSIMFKRFDLARQIGCDGIESAHNDAEVYGPGFTIPTDQTYAWYDEVAKQGHDRMLSTGMKGGDTIGTVNDGKAKEFDWLMLERCGELSNCDVARPFISAEKAVLAIEYDINQDTQAPQDPAMVCANQKPFIMDGLVKDVALTSRVRTQCVP